MRAKEKITNERILKFLQELDSHNVHTSADHDLPEKLMNEMHTLEGFFEMRVKAKADTIEDGLNIPIVSNNEVADCTCENSTWNRDAGCLMCDDCNERI